MKLSLKGFVKTYVEPEILLIMSSEFWQKTKWLINAAVRYVRCRTPCIRVFLSSDDAYSFIILQVLDSFVKRWNLDVEVIVIPFRKEKTEAYRNYEKWAIKDAISFSALYNIKPPFKKKINADTEQYHERINCLMMRAWENTRSYVDVLHVLKLVWDETVHEVKMEGHAHLSF